MKAIHLVILAIVGVSIFMAISIMKRQQEPAAPPALRGPPPYAVFLEAGTTPEAVAGGGNHFVDMWVPEPGWQVAVEKITTEESGYKTLRIALTQSNPLWGQMWVVAMVPEETDIRERDFCMLVGRVASVDKFQDGGPVEATRVLLRDARVVKNLSRGG